MSEEIFGYQVDVELTADGQQLGMNEFVRTIFQGAIKGMVSALKVPENTKDIMLQVHLKRQGS